MMGLNPSAAGNAMMNTSNNNHNGAGWQGPQNSPSKLMYNNNNNNMNPNVKSYIPSPNMMNNYGTNNNSNNYNNYNNNNNNNHNNTNNNVMMGSQLKHPNHSSNSNSMGNGNMPNQNSFGGGGNGNGYSSMVPDNNSATQPLIGSNGMGSGAFNPMMMFPQLLAQRLSLQRQQQPQSLQQSSFMQPPNDIVLFGKEPFSLEEREAIQKSLRKRLSPEYISERPQGGTRVSYLEGWRAIELANDTFGFSGWTSLVQDVSVDFLDQTPEGKFNTGISALVRVMLKNGVYHEDIGYGTAENQKTKSAALEKAKKEAITDGLKRTLRMYGNSLGNCLYDRDFLRKLKQFPKNPKDISTDDLITERSGGPAVFIVNEILKQQQQQEEPQLTSAKPEGPTTIKASMAAATPTKTTATTSESTFSNGKQTHPIVAPATHPIAAPATHPTSASIGGTGDVNGNTPIAPEDDFDDAIDLLLYEAACEVEQSVECDQVARVLTSTTMINKNATSHPTTTTNTSSTTIISTSSASATLAQLSTSNSKSTSINSATPPTSTTTITASTSIPEMNTVPKFDNAVPPEKRQRIE